MLDRLEDLRPIKRPLAILQSASGLGFVLLIIALPWSIAPMSIGAAICAVTTLLVWVLPGGGRPRSTPVDRAAVGWMVALVLAALFAVDRPASLARLGKGLLPALVPLGAYHAAHRRAGQNALIWLLLSSAAASILGIAFFVGRGAGFLSRARGPVGHYMTYAGQLLLLVAVAAAIALLARQARWRWGSLTVAVLGVVALGATFTRSAWIGTAVALAVIVAGARSRWLPWLAVLLVTVVLLAPEQYRERLRSAIDPHHATNLERTYMWRAGAAMFRDHPITGVGLQDLKPLYDRYRPPEARERAGHLHSVPIQIAASMGLVGLVMFAWLYASLLRTTATGLRRNLAARGVAAGVRLGVLAGLCGFLVAGLFEWNFGDEELLYLLYTLVGLAWAARAWDPPAPSPATGATGRTEPAEAVTA